MVIGHRRSGQVRATLTGLGLVFGIQDALTRQTLETLQGSSWTVLFTTWSAYALVGAGIVGIWLMQNAFSAAPLHASLPAIAAGEPLAGIALGILVFGDRVEITPGLLAIEAGGIALLVVGVIAVASSTAFSGLRKITVAIKPDAAEPRTRPHRTGRTRRIHPTAGRRAGSPRSARRPPDIVVRGPGRGACCATAPAPRRFPATRTGSAFTIPRPATAAEPNSAPGSAKLCAGRSPAVLSTAGDRPVVQPLRAEPRFSIPSSAAVMLPSVTDQPPDDHDHGGDGPEVAADPQDRRADLLVGERRQGDPGHVGVHRVPPSLGEDAQRHRRIHMTTLVASSAAAWETSGIRRRNGGDGMNCSQNSTPARKKLACISQMCTAWLFSRQVEQRGQVPGQHHHIEQHHRDPRPEQEPANGAQRPRPAARSTPAVALRPGPAGQPVEQRLPRRPGHDQRRRGEHEQQVLDHVHEEVVVGPVVHRRFHRDEQHGQPGVEPQRAQPPLAGSAPAGTAGPAGPARSRATATTTATIRNGSNDQ